MRAAPQDRDDRANDATPFDTLVTEQQAEPKDSRKTERASQHAPEQAKAEKTAREKSDRDPADDAGTAGAETAMETDGRTNGRAAQAVQTPDTAREKSRPHAALDGDAPDAAPKPVDADAADAAALQANAGQTGQAAPPQDQKTQNPQTQAALAALTETGAAAPKDIAPLNAAAEKKTNGVQPAGQPSEQRSEAAGAVTGEKPAAPDGQGQDLAQQDGGEARTGTQAQAETRPGAPDSKDAGLKSLTDTARAEMMPDAAPKPQPPAPATNMAASGLVSPDTGAPAQSAAPAVTQHVQVTMQAEAAPDLPRLAVDIAARSQGGAKQFDIRLDPPELGRVEVRLSIDHDGKTSAHLTAEQPRTLDLLQRDSVLLTRALRDAGLDVSQDNLNFSLRQQAQEGGHHLAGHPGRDQGQGRGARGLSLAASRTIEATATSAAWRGPSDGRLDIRV